MFCQKCGKELPDGAKFCTGCGNSIISDEVIGKEKNETTSANNASAQNNMNQGAVDSASEIVIPKAISIVAVVAAALLILVGFSDIDYDWGLISLTAGIGILAVGILELLKKQSKVCSIVQIVFGAVTALVGVCCDLDYDWGYIGILIGASLVVSGVLKLIHKSVKVMAITEIAFAGVLLLCGIADADFDCGIIAMFAGTEILVSGILYLVKCRQYRW